jgi:hypothetical protein
VTSSYRGPELTPQQIIELAQKISNAPRTDQNEMRRFVFREALGAGDLDDELQDRYESAPVLDEYGEELPTPSIGELRGEAGPSDFPNEIPFRGESVDPDYEDYSPYNYVNSNPELRAAMERGPIEIADVPALRQGLYESIRNGEVLPRRLDAFRRYGSSNILESDLSDAEAFSLADELNRAASRDPNVPSLQPTFQNTAESLDTLSRTVEPVISAITQQNDFQERVRRLASDISGGDYRSRNVLQPPIPGLVPGSEALTEAFTPSDPWPERLDELQEGRNRLRVLTRDLTALEGRISQASSPGALRAAVEQRVLPAVRDALGERGVDEAVYNELVNTRIENQPDSEARTEEIARMREQRTMEDALSRRSGTITQFEQPPIFYNVDTRRADSGLNSQPFITGINSAIDEANLQSKFLANSEKLNELDKLLERYPEVRTLFEANLKSGERPVLSGPEAIKKLSSYVDTAQQTSMPRERAALLNKLITEGNLSLEAATDIEKKYRSGDTLSQAEAIQQVKEAGGDLEAIGQPAISRRNPVVGGGSYFLDVPSSIPPELKSRLNSAAQRSVLLNRVLQDIDPQILYSRFPGLKPQQEFDRPQQAEFVLTPEGKALETPVGQGDYGVKYYKGRVGDRVQLMNPMDAFGGSVSENVVRFLLDNPVLAKSSFSFETKTPEKGFYDFAAPSDLPPEIAKKFQTFLSSNATRDVAPGTILTNSPIASSDLVNVAADNSATARKFEQFVGELPNKRAAAYRRVGYGPVTRSGSQYLYITPEGNAVPMQPGHASAPLIGKNIPDSQGMLSTIQDRTKLSERAYYAMDPISAAATSARELGKGAVGGAAFSLLNDEVAKQLAKDNYAAAGKAFASDVGTGMAVDAALQGGSQLLRKAAPSVAARALPFAGAAANVAGPVIAGAALFTQGRSGSALDTLANKGAKYIPGLKTNPETDLARRASSAIANESGYILRSLLQGKLPYSR